MLCGNKLEPADGDELVVEDSEQSSSYSSDKRASGEVADRSSDRGVHETECPAIGVDVDEGGSPKEKCSPKEDYQTAQCNGRFDDHQPGKLDDTPCKATEGPVERFVGDVDWVDLEHLPPKFAVELEVAGAIRVGINLS